MKRSELTTYSIIIFLITIAIITTPSILPVLGANTTYFNVTATVNSGNPTITNVEAISNTPNEGTTKIVGFYFNATHPNGPSAIPATGATVRINQSGTTLTSGACAVISTNGITMNRYECNVTIFYYTLPGAWTINATISDGDTAVTNTSVYYTNGNVWGVVVNSSISFAGNPGDVIASTGQYINNTGNSQFGQINITAIELRSGTNVISPANFSVNTTNGGAGGLGQKMINNTIVSLLNATIAVNTSKHLYMYLTIPNGTANGTYNSTSAWTVTVGG